MSVTAETEDADVYIELDTNNPKGERWESAIQMSDDASNTVMMNGETVNCRIFNTNSHNVKQWSFKITTGKECYLNGFWGGTIEIHQFRNGEEIVETVPEIVANSKINSLETNHYMNSMMIRLRPGDYFIFSPYRGIGVDNIKANDSISVVYNFYYVQPLDFSDYEISYQNSVEVTETWQYKVLTLVWLVWLLVMFLYHTAIITHKRLLRDVRNSDRNISVMADLYLETVRIDVKNKTGYHISQKEGKPMLKTDSGSIQDCLYAYADEDCYDIYEKDLKAFFDLSTLEQRMGDASSIVFEYQSKSIGWCSLRFFILSKSKEGNQYVLAFQDINEERRKLHEYEEHIRHSENAMLTQGNFMDTIYYALSGMAFGIRQNMGTLQDMLDDEDQKILAESIGLNVEHFLLLGGFVYDLFSIESDRLNINSEEYNIYDMVYSLEGMLLPFQEGKEFSFQTDIDSILPAKLMGDKKRIMQILVVLLSSSMLMTEKGTVKLSIFGKQEGEKEQLLFSVRDASAGFKEEELEEIEEMMNDLGKNPMGNAAYVYFQIMNQVLKKMNSELKIVSSYGSGNEFYFSIDQDIVK